MYFQGFIAVHKASVGGVLEMAITGLTVEEQIEVVKGLSKYLVNQGLVGEGVSSPFPVSPAVACELANRRLAGPGLPQRSHEYRCQITDPSIAFFTLP